MAEAISLLCDSSPGYDKDLLAVWDDYEPELAKPVMALIFFLPNDEKGKTKKWGQRRRDLVSGRNLHDHDVCSKFAWHCFGPTGVTPHYIFSSFAKYVSKFCCLIPLLKVQVTTAAFKKQAGVNIF